MRTDTPASIEKLLTHREAGAILGVSDRTVWSLVQRGELRGIKIGCQNRIDPADLRAYIDRLKGGAR